MRALRTVSQSGFSLIEMAVVLLIIGLILGGIFKGQSSLLQGSRTHDAIQTASDLSGILSEFKNRYHYLPGDFPIDPASPEIPDLDAACMGTAAPKGNGIINAGGESDCVPEHLLRADFIKAEIDPATNLPVIKTAYGRVRVIANNVDNVLPPRFINVIEFVGQQPGVTDALPCDVALDIDRKIDDGNLATGNVRADAASQGCTPGGTTGVLYLAIGF